MRKLYGSSLRKEAGFVKVIKNVASKNARMLESRAVRHAPEIRRVAKEVAKEVQGTFHKVYEETAQILEEFLAKCASSGDIVYARSHQKRSAAKPRISEVVQDTKFLLQQSRERLIITWVILLLLRSSFVDCARNPGALRMTYLHMTQRSIKFLLCLPTRPAHFGSISANRSE